MSGRYNRMGDNDMDTCSKVMYWIYIIVLLGSVLAILGLSIATFIRINDTHYTCYIVEDLFKEYLNITV